VTTPYVTGEPARGALPGTPLAKALARRALLVTLAALAVVVLALARPSPSLAADGSAHQPYELWKTFPLGQKAHAPSTAPSGSTTHVPPPTRRISPAGAPISRGPSAQSGGDTPLWTLAYLVLALTGIAAAALLVRERRSIPSRSRAPSAAGRIAWLTDLRAHARVPERVRHLGRVLRQPRQLEPAEPGPLGTSPEDPLRASTTLRVLARLHDAGVLDDDEFAAKQAKVVQADSLRALADLHDNGLLDDEQFAAKTAQLREGAARGG
jgi:hypothetical protein